MMSWQYDRSTILLTATPYKPTVGLISFVGVQFAPQSTAATPVTSTLGGCSLGRDGNCCFTPPSIFTSSWMRVGNGACSTLE